MSQLRWFLLSGAAVGVAALLGSSNLGSTDTGAVVIVVLCAVAVGVGIGLMVYLDGRRTRALKALAGRFRFVFSPKPDGPMPSGVELLRRGSDRWMSNMLSGTWRSMPFIAFDYSYQRQVMDRTARFYFQVALVELGVSLPPTRITPEGLTSTLADVVGLRDIDFESAEFNARFQVQSSDRQFAFELIDPLVMRWLLSVGDRYSFQVEGRTLVCYCKPLQPAEMLNPIGYLRELSERIPALVMQKYALPAAEPSKSVST